MEYGIPKAHDETDRSNESNACENAGPEIQWMGPSQASGEEAAQAKRFQWELVELVVGQCWWCSWWLVVVVVRMRMSDSGDQIWLIMIMVY